MDPARVTTLAELPGFAIKRALGVVHGMGKPRDAGLKLGVAIDHHLPAQYEEARMMGLAAIMQAALGVGANAVVGLRYELSTWADGVPIVLAYGTAVEVA